MVEISIRLTYDGFLQGYTAETTIGGVQYYAGGVTANSALYDLMHLILEECDASKVKIATTLLRG